MNESDSEDADDIEFSGTLNRLTTIVREQYKSNLEKAIRENYCNWTSLEYGGVKAPASSYVQKWTDMFEEKAIKACMIAQFYRKEMLNFMNQIKEFTKKGQLITCNETFPALNSPCSSTQVSSTTTEEKSIQTDREKRPHLSERDISFLKEFRRSQHNKRPRREKKIDEPRVEEPPKPIQVPIPQISPDPFLDIFEDPMISEENLELHLSAMFNEQTETTIHLEEPVEPVEDEGHVSLTIDEDYDPEIKKLLQDIDENHRLLKSRSKEEQQQDLFKSPIRLPPLENNDDCRKELMKSIWPCKLYHHRKQLQENLLHFYELNSRNADLIKQRFLEVFGEDSDDEIGAFSPSHDMDSELLLSSSKKRVAPMVVQNLMEPFQKKLIGDKAAFKKLAQDFTECIIANDLYPSFLEVKQLVDNYFDDGQDDANIDIHALLQ